MPNDLHDLVGSQRAFFASGQTRDLAFRIRQLRQLQAVVATAEDTVLQALEADLGKSAYEAYLSEIGIVRSELRFTLNRVRRWAASRRVPTPLTGLPGSSRIYPQPYGVVLVISPWNFPFLLSMTPLIGALAAGNCCILKPSEYAPQTSAAMATLIAEHFDPRYLAAVEGSADVGESLLAHRFDSIFFTGGTAVGRIVMQAAARYLTPVTLELGGKSPCIVDRSIAVDHAARKIVAGKFLNAGQTCIAPDFLLVDATVRPKLVDSITEQITRFFGTDPRQSRDYARIISRRHFDRLAGLLGSGRIVFGGKTDRQQCYFDPTVLDEVGWEDPIMQEEIFGPILPILTYDDLGEAVARVRELPPPLALYLFSDDPAVQEKVIEEVTFGGGCINDTLVHFANPHLPFGGIGTSGLGRYHGRFSFDTFSHFKGVMKKPAWFHTPLRYPPYGNLSRLKKLLR
ncbi:MAG: aldehyde dehydrogenase [Deltaproteobacteria bacterium SG8_13]|nr:MAG: aldehyde dehydrogenase [Deltaproteobacteria bacterium SG8_13]